MVVKAEIRTVLTSSITPEIEDLRKPGEGEYSGRRPVS